ncbi:MAG: aminopeptidase [Phycisphaerales bacterium]
MHDPRHDTLAEVLARHSTGLQAGEHVLIEAFEIPSPMVVAMVRAARAAGAHPHVALRDGSVMRALLESADEAQIATWADIDRHRMEKMDAYIGLRGSANVSEMSDVPDEQMQTWGSVYAKPVHFQQRVNHTRWCVLRWPSASMAQLAGMSTEAFERFYFDVCTMDYSRMAEAVKPLVETMEKARDVHIKGPGDTDLRFSIADMPVIPCTGSHNIPDGECFSAPVRDSVEGVIEYNTPTIYRGTSFENIKLRFKAGRIVEATADGDQPALDAIFDTDEGAKFIGEFAIGFNPYIENAMKDILFDEKIAGSLHFTPGQAYEDCDNGNRSDIHWDLVLIQRPDHGGGTISFDGEVIRKDGLFVPAHLAGLNPKALIGG